MRGELRLEPGWKTDEGFTSLALAGKKQIRIFPAAKPDILRRFAK
jgi:hypothetical protein